MSEQCNRALWYSFRWVNEAGNEFCGEKIIIDNRPPQKLHTSIHHPVCGLCAHSALCHGVALAQVNCRTCAHSTATEAAEWLCEYHNRTMTVAEQQAACPSHVWHPDLLANTAEPIGANPQTGSITFRRRDGATVEIGLSGISTRQLLAESEPVIQPDIIDVLGEIAAAMALPEQQIIAGKLTESDFPKLTQAVVQFWDRWHHDEPRMARLRALIEAIDGAYYAGMEGMKG